MGNLGPSPYGGGAIRSKDLGSVSPHTRMAMLPQRKTHYQGKRLTAVAAKPSIPYTNLPSIVVTEGSLELRP